MLVLLLIVLSSCQSQDLGLNEKDVDSFAVEDGSSVLLLKDPLKATQRRRSQRNQWRPCPSNRKQETQDPCLEKFVKVMAVCEGYCDQLIIRDNAISAHDND